MHQGENIWVTEKSLIAKNETKLYSRANKILNHCLVELVSSLSLDIFTKKLNILIFWSDCVSSHNWANKMGVWRESNSDYEQLQGVFKEQKK